MMQREGVPVVVSAPSGGGKTTLCRRVIELLGGAAFSVSYTTRAPRPGERDGIDYHFVSDGVFSKMIEDNAFLEWAHVHGQRYGTGRAETEKLLRAGIDVFFDIDVQGGRQIRAQRPDAILVFVNAPDMATLEARLRARRSDSDEQIARRLREAAHEIEQGASYTHFVVNEELNKAVQDLAEIVRGARKMSTKR